MNRAQNLDRGFGVNPARAWIPLFGRFGLDHGLSSTDFSLWVSK
jgi:hypothetical protein